MNLRDLEYLVAVAEHLHFGKAAAACNVSQPTLSMQIRKLEESLGIALFERTNKQVMVTQAGEAVIGHARSMLQGAKDIRAIARTAQSPFAGEFRLGAFPTLAPYFLPLAVPAIARELPELKLLLLEEKTAVLLEKLRQGELDAALIALPLHLDGLEEEKLFDDPFLLAVPQSHRLASHATVSEQDMKGEEVLLLEEGHCLREHALEVCSLMDMPEHQDFRATSMETLRQMVASGTGITLIPQIARRADDGVAYIPFTGHAPSRAIGLVWRKTSPRRECMQALVRILRSIFPDLQAGRIDYA